MEDEPTTAKPADTLAEEEEYEKQQEELRREEAQASHGKSHQFCYVLLAINLINFASSPCNCYKHFNQLRCIFLLTS